MVLTILTASLGPASRKYGDLVQGEVRRYLKTHDIDEPVSIMN